ncbi:unnamed protein product [Dovyalis caffra]|uniref:C2H2-type domain-containing protein n=1 Tax=Dovyalis caffra TaxID=77055 RepID=A0AAV1RT06_9ROSI|nr:unnamed protein product [Dovyalis caffra]
MVVMEEEQVEKERPVIFRDIRRYYCDYCGICRSKKSLITSHVLTRHKEEMDKQRVDGDEGKEEVKSNTCEKRGASFKKPAYLIQHMQSHSLELKYQAGRPPEKLHQASLNHAPVEVERPFACSVDDCHASYRRKDHLTRHLLLHEGKLLKCQIENCNCKFVYPSNMKRHVRELHDESSPSYSGEGEKQYICQETRCGKVFRYPSKLRTHEDSHVNLEFVKAMRLEPGCCDMRFSYKHVRDNHEKSSLYVYTPKMNWHSEIGLLLDEGDFEESDRQFKSKPRGGRKRKFPTVEMLIRKRVTLPTKLD